MDQNVINVAIGVVMAIGGLVTGAIGWYARTIWDKGEENAERITKLEIKLAGEYVSNQELASAMMDIKNVLINAVSQMKDDMTYIRARVDGISQHRRAGDPP